MQIITMTSDRYTHLLKPFMWLFRKYFDSQTPSYINTDKVFCGFTKPNINFQEYGWRWHSIGNFDDYPANKWSDAFIKVLDDVADKQFLLMLEDYWLCRQSDVIGIVNMFGYAKQFQNVLKICVTSERLNNKPAEHYYKGANSYGHAGHLDLIRSPPGSTYQMSLWGGIWNRDVLRPFIIPGERAQEIETHGTSRVNGEGDKVMVIGSRSSPIVHGNILWSAFNEPVYKDPYGSSWEVLKDDLVKMKKDGIWEL